MNNDLLIRDAVLLCPVVDCPVILACVLISPTSAAQVIRRFRKPFEGGIAIAHYGLAKVIPAMTQMPDVNFVKVPSFHTEVCKSSDILSFSLAILLRRYQSRTHETMKLVKHRNHSALWM